MLKDNGFKLTEMEKEHINETVVEIDTLEDLKKLIEVVDQAIVINMYCDDILIYDDYIE